MKDNTNVLYVSSKFFIQYIVSIYDNNIIITIIQCQLEQIQNQSYYKAILFK